MCSDANLDYDQDMGCRRLIMSIVLAFSFTAGAGGEDRSLRFVFTEYAPANYVDASGAHTGFFVDIIRAALAERLGVPLVTEVYPWKRCQTMVETGEADMMATIPTPDRLVYSVVVEQPIWTKHYRVYTYARHPELERMNRLRSVEDLKREGFSVISYLGNNWAETTLAAAGIPMHDATSVEGMYRMLSARRADILVEDPILAAPMLTELAGSTDLVLTEGVIEQSGFHLLLSLRSPFAAKARLVSDTLKAMHADGTMERILDKYR